MIIWKMDNAKEIIEITKDEKTMILTFSELFRMSADAVSGKDIAGSKRSD